MEKRYLINNKVMQGDEMPKESSWLTWEFKLVLNGWKKSLTKLACDESELNKINIIYLKEDPRNPSPIDITSITTIKDGKVFFKDVNIDTNESIVFAEWILQNCTSYKSSNDWHYYTDDGTIRKTTKELYEIFKEENR